MEGSTSGCEGRSNAQKLLRPSRILMLSRERLTGCHHMQCNFRELSLPYSYCHSQAQDLSIDVLKSCLLHGPYGGVKSHQVGGCRLIWLQVVTA